MMHGNLIGGNWQETAQGFDNINPSDTRDIIGRYAASSPADAQAALAAARAAQKQWAASTPQMRFDILDRAAEEILARKAELGDLLAREEGKTLPEAIGEATRAGMIFKFFAGEALRPGGEMLPSVRANVSVEISREPVGVVAAITPWNFPLAIPAWKVAPALAYGNCVILKPAEIAPGCAWALADILHRAGLPAGVFNLLLGQGAILGPILAQQSDAISFTGSTGVGRDVCQTAAAAGTRVQLEMGGKNPLIVLDDADLDTAVECAVQGAFYSTGQRCTASSRLIVTPGIADRFAEALAKATRALRVGDARHPDTQIGPLASEAQMDKVRSYIEGAAAEEAELIAGKEPLHPDQPGHYLRPHLFDHCTAEMAICREEIFGPVASIERVADYEAAIEAANATSFGLASGICTTSLKYAADFKRRAEAGMTMVNLPTAGVDYHVPFGGRKASSYGPREQGSYAREFFTTVKTSYQFAG
ncbi:aldehyde dehydrogenase family protein [Sphingopyxis sp. MWB1]|uniref:aldehyde dehydrogenase family protein n=1 Tax=Sphingopyxis sp. MWB1 TaxID=1537715 RepID=UPI000AC8BF50|nr:aldehyde dehydrogenase family protein [Sphingopyxis sp. MWB1]